MQLEKLEELNKYITILIVDDDFGSRNSLKMILEDEGYETVWAVEKAEEAQEYLSRTNILLVDYDLQTSLMNGIQLIEKAKAEYKEKIEAIIFTGEENNKTFIKQKVSEIKASAYFDKVDLINKMDYLTLWIRELGKRIWLQQILDNEADEIVIIDRFGTILMVDKEKECIFGENLIGDKCYRRFEIGDSDNTMCKECPCSRAYDRKQIIRTEWEYTTRGDILKHKVHQIEQTVDTIAAPLYDIQKEPRAIIEIRRDITQQKVVEKSIAEMEKTQDWEERKAIFIDGFKRLGYPRGLLYLRFIHEGKDEFRMIDHWGEYNESLCKIDRIQDNRLSQLMIGYQQPLLYKIDQVNPQREYEQDQLIKNLFYVGKEKIQEYEKLKRNEWVEVPLQSNGEVIGKVSIDGWLPGESPNNYDLEVLARYGVAAGQIIENARQRRNIELRESMRQALLEISSEITNINSPNPLQDAVKRAVEAMRIGMCSIFLKNEASGNLEIKHSYGRNINGKELPKEHFAYENQVGGGALTLNMFKRDDSKYINDDALQEIIRKEKEDKTKGEISITVLEQYEKILGEPFRNCLFVLLIVGGEKIGLLRAVNKLDYNDFGDQNFNHEDTEMFEQLAGLIAVALYNNATLVKEKEVHMEALVHNVRSSLQSVFSVAGKFTKEKPLLWDEIKKYGTELEESLIVTRNLIEEFSLIIKPKDPGSYEFASHPLDSLIMEVRGWVRSKYKIETRLDNITYIGIYCDRRQLQHAFYNLIDNAIKYSQTKDKPIIIQSQIEGEIVRTDVINYSNEIPIYEREKIFEENYRSTWAKEVTTGLGRGLAMTKQIIEKHQGKIKVTSVPDEAGLYKNTFSVYLPYRGRMN